MKSSRNNFMSVIFLTIISSLYSLIFFVTAGHIEFQSMMYTGEYESKLMQLWADFLREGNQKFIAISYVVLTIIIILVFIFRKQNRGDEYQYYILRKSLGIVGFFSLLASPFLILMYLSVPNGLIEATLLLTAIQWFIVLFYELYIMFKFIK